MSGTLNEVGTLLSEIRRLADQVQRLEQSTHHEAGRVQPMLFDAEEQRLAAQEAIGLSRHLVDFSRDLAGRGGCPRHARDAVRRVRRMLHLCRASLAVRPARSLRSADLRPSVVRGALSLLASCERDLGQATLNHYLVSFKTFARWLINDGRAEGNPCRGLRPIKVTDVRRPRRALSVTEAQALVRIANAAEVIRGIPGYERALGYAIVLTTAVRAAELQSLTEDSFRWTLDTAGVEQGEVVIQARHSKNGRRAVLPLRSDIAAAVRAHIAMRAAGSADPAAARSARLFRRPARGTFALQRDLAAAGIAYRTEEGYADFHALRHSCVTNLSLFGASTKELQGMARHSDPSLTIRVYAHSDSAGLRAAVERLPALFSKCEAVDGDRPGDLCVGQQQRRQASICPAPSDNGSAGFGPFTNERTACCQHNAPSRT